MRILTATTLFAVLLATAGIARAGDIEEAIAALPDHDVTLVARGAPWSTGLAPQQFGGYRSSTWTWELTPWFWGAAIDGDITADGEKESVSTGFGDLFSSTAPNFGLGFGLEIWEADAGFLFDTEWMSHGDERGGIERKIDQNSMDVGIAYRFGEVAERRANRSRWSTGELQLLARWVFLRQELDPGRGPTRAARNNWWEVVVGAVGDFSLTKEWELSVRWDVGGFGIATAANVDTSLSATIGYAITKTVVLKLGYRISYLDYVSGSGPNELATQIYRHGVLLAATFRL